MHLLLLLIYTKELSFSFTGDKPTSHFSGLRCASNWYSKRCFSSCPFVSSSNSSTLPSYAFTFAVTLFYEILMWLRFPTINAATEKIIIMINYITKFARIV